MSNLDTLPLEIFCKIVDNLVYWDLIRCSQVNKNLRNLFTDEGFWKIILFDAFHKKPESEFKSCYMGELIKKYYAVYKFYKTKITNKNMEIKSLNDIRKHRSKTQRELLDYAIGMYNIDIQTSSRELIRVTKEIRRLIKSTIPINEYKFITFPELLKYNRTQIVELIYRKILLGEIKPGNFIRIITFLQKKKSDLLFFYDPDITEITMETISEDLSFVKSDSYTAGTQRFLEKYLSSMNSEQAAFYFNTLIPILTEIVWNQEFIITSEPMD